MPKPPTNAQLLKWWAEQPRGTFTCTDCGRVDSDAYVQPQHPFYCKDPNVPEWRCGDCINRRNQEAKERHKAELAKLPRCEVDGCGRRGTMRLRGVLLCGRHCRKAQAAHQAAMGSMGVMALFMPPPAYTRDELLAMASK